MKTTVNKLLVGYIVYVSKHTPKKDLIAVKNINIGRDKHYRRS